MNKNRLGRSGIIVSDICMGTMTFGNQADEKTAFRIMDMAYEAGIDFYDTAEMSVVTLATAWSKQHDFVASTIVGATHPDQMHDILAAADVTLTPEVMKQINAVSREIRNPMG